MDVTEQANLQEQQPAGALSTEQAPAVPVQTIPYDRFQQVIKERNELEKRLKALEDKDAQRLEAERIEAGKFQEVIEELRPKAARVEVLEATLTEFLQAELESIPEQYRDLVPEGDITARLQFIAKAKAKGLFAPATPVKTDAGARGDSVEVAKASAEDKAWAERLGMSLETYLKQKQAANKERG